MTTAKAKTLVEKLVAVREAVGGYVQKTGRNTAQSYNFASEAAITSKIYPAFAAEGILFYPETRRVIGVLEYTTAKGGKMLMTTTESKWVATDGVDRIEVMTIGQGADSGDKGAYKGMAGDKKYAILQLLGIATGDDPEVTRDDEKEETSSSKAKASKPAAEAPPADETAEETPEEKLARGKRKMFAMAKDAGIDTNTAEGKKTLQAIVFAATNKRSSKELALEDMSKIFETLKQSADEPAEVAA